MSSNKRDSKGDSTKESKKVPSGTSLKEIEKKRRQVFKPVLDNPYTQSTVWPFVEPEIGTNLVDLLCMLISAIGNYNKVPPNTRKETGVPVPKIKSHVTVGFNSTVEALEKQASVHRERLMHKKRKTSSNKTKEGRYIKYVFVAKYDISPSILTNHFPVLSFTASHSKGNRVKLVQLPRGSMARLSEALNSENTGIIGLEEGVEQAQAMCAMVDQSIKDVEVPWLDGLFESDGAFFTKPALNFLSTSAPILPKKNDQKAKNKATKEKETKSKEISDTKKRNDQGKHSEPSI